MGSSPLAAWLSASYLTSLSLSCEKGLSRVSDIAHGASVRAHRRAGKWGGSGSRSYCKQTARVRRGTAGGAPSARPQSRLASLEGRVQARALKTARPLEAVFRNRFLPTQGGIETLEAPLAKGTGWREAAQSYQNLFLCFPKASCGFCRLYQAASPGCRADHSRVNWKKYLVFSSRRGSSNIYPAFTLFQCGNWVLFT